MVPRQDVRIGEASGRGDPFVAAVGEHLVFPDRHFGLEPVDQRTAGVVRLVSVGGGRRHEYGDLTDLQRTDPVYGGQRVHVVLVGDLLRDLPQPLQRTRVGRVVEVGDRFAVVVVAHEAAEQVHCTSPRIVHGTKDLCWVERTLADVDQADHVGHLISLGPSGRRSNLDAMNDQPQQPDDNPFKGTPFEQLFGALGGQRGMPGQGFGQGFGQGPGQMPFDLSGLMSQMQSMMQPYDGPVHWDLAFDTARKVAAQKPDPTPSGNVQSAVADAFRLADHWLDSATPLSSGVARTAAWSRADWIDQTREVWQVLVTPVAESVIGAMGQAMPDEARAMVGPLIGMIGKAGGAMFGSQIGQAVGGLAGEVLTASDIGLPLGPDGTAALVTDNVREFAEGLDLAEHDVLLYLALREAAHQRLFAGVPWLRSHLISAVADFGGALSIDTAGIEEVMRNLDPSNPGAIQEAMEGGLFEPKRSPAQEAALTRLETTLALVEGWVDEVVGQATAERMPAAARMQEAIRRRRAAGGPAEETFSALVGLQLRPRRLRDASTLWGSLRSRQGADGRDAVWAHPDLLPTAADLDDPLGFRDNMNDSGELSDEDFDRELGKLLDEG